MNWVTSIWPQSNSIFFPTLIGLQRTKNHKEWWRIEGDSKRKKFWKFTFNGASNLLDLDSNCAWPYFRTLLEVIRIKKKSELLEFQSQNLSWSKFQKEKCSTWELVPLIPPFQKVQDNLIWLKYEGLAHGCKLKDHLDAFTSTFHTRSHGFVTWFQHDLHSIMNVIASLDGPITHPCKHAKRIT
jgi:hypothetical protein